MTTLQPAAHVHSRNLSAYERSANRRRADTERAASLRPTAVAAARSDKERQLLTEIFTHIPKVLALSEAHSTLEAEGKDAELAERRWMRALDQLQSKLGQLINLPVQSADDAHRRLTIWRQTRGLIEMPEASADLKSLDREDLHVIAEAALKAIKSLASPKPTDTDRIWSEALDRFLKADAAHRDPALSDDAWDAATDRAAELEGELHRTPAPNIAALAEKMRLTLKLQIEDEREDDVDDPRTIAVALAADDCVVREQVLAYQDALRLSGLRPAIAAVTPFDPAPFIEASVAANVSLDVVEDDGGNLLLAPFMTPPIDASAGQPLELFAALNELRQGELGVLRRRLHDNRRAPLQ